MSKCANRLLLVEVTKYLLYTGSGCHQGLWSKSFLALRSLKWRFQRLNLGLSVLQSVCSVAELWRALVHTRTQSKGGRSMTLISPSTEQHPIHLATIVMLKLHWKRLGFKSPQLYGDLNPSLSDALSIIHSSMYHTGFLFHKCFLWLLVAFCSWRHWDVCI